MKNFSKFMKNTKFKSSILLIFLFTLYIFLSASAYVNAISADIANSVFRLHVIANSDSEVDQNLKYKVRDNLLEYMNSITKNAKTKEEIIQIAMSHQENFQTIAEETIYENGFSYPVHIQIGNFEFPTKTYGDISFPAGYYDALRVEIGEATGQNWWCVMFPPLCFVDVSSGIVPDDSKDIIKSNISEEEYKIISEGNNDSSNKADIKFKFKLIEFFQNNNITTAHN